MTMVFRVKIVFRAMCLQQAPQRARSALLASISTVVMVLALIAQQGSSAMQEAQCVTVAGLEQQRQRAVETAAHVR